MAMIPGLRTQVPQGVGVVLPDVGRHLQHREGGLAPAAAAAVEGAGQGEEQAVALVDQQGAQAHLHLAAVVAVKKCRQRRLPATEGVFLGTSYLTALSMCVGEMSSGKTFSVPQASPFHSWGPKKGI